MLLSVTPVCIFIFIDIYKSILVKNFVTVIRHCTIVGPFLGVFFKIMIMHIKEKTAMQIINEINRDYELFNTMSPSYQEIIDAAIVNSLQYSERAWTITVLCVVLIFPVMAAVLNVYNFTFKSEPAKYMVHDLPKPYGEPEERFDTPYFEIMFIYMVYCAILYIVNFVGYDGFFGLCINHACLKMQLYCQAFKEALASENMHEKIAGVIKEQNRLFEYVDLIQDTFNVWLGIILIATMIQICNCMYHITESVETATHFYISGWEHVNNIPIRKMVLFMVARAQVPLEITAFNKLIFDMDLFVSILQTSYSMYTLLRS
ncbi:uncharacterized protein LOC123717507 [Pieris brassicae]|uniref:uncharacterized protein LOC123717507 n=1 Tax=Pieris brassicae TaxID=7116 RepID=UPI001E65FCC9|nr:uncharacterized protein LOC123717507 [Pieris brassicae]